MIVTLYTSRVVLNALGIEDYGVYNAVGGVVSMFAIISGALSNAISRYITYGIGKENAEQLNLVFCSSVNILIIISVVVLILCEVAGLWFVNTKMNIPPDRIVAANWVLHCTLFAFVINLISVPYNACIIAHEHMNAYAYISIVDALLKLGVVYLLIISPIDKLIAYSFLLFITSLIVRMLYGYYCSRHFKECHYKMIYNKRLFKEMLSFAGWNFFTNGASVLNIQGVNILVNVFFGVVANSARGIAMQVDSAVNQFVMTFTTAVNPQITKSFAQGDNHRMFYLICKGAKFSYLLLLYFAIPLFLEADIILQLWIVNVPENAVLFVQLSIIGALVTVLGNTGYTACLATGKIKGYSIWITTIGSFVFILTWILYSLGAPVFITYVVYIVVYAGVQIVRLIIMHNLLGFPLVQFFREVILPITYTSVSAIIIPVLVYVNLSESLCRLLITLTISFICVSLSIYIFALTKGERIRVSNKVSKIIKR